MGRLCRGGWGFLIVSCDLCRCPGLMMYVNCANHLFSSSRYLPKTTHETHPPMDPRPRHHLARRWHRSPSLRAGLHVRQLLHRDRQSRAQPLALCQASATFTHRNLVFLSIRQHSDKQPPHGEARARGKRPRLDGTPDRDDGFARPYHLLPSAERYSCG